MLLEIPPGLSVEHVRASLEFFGSLNLRFVTASHAHDDHLDPEVWNAMIDAYPDADYLSPDEIEADRYIELAGEPLWLVKAPKHSRDDIVTIFRGVAMTGDIELGVLESVNREVSKKTKAASMDHLRSFQDRTGYRINAIVSAHLNDLRKKVNWSDLFAY